MDISEEERGSQALEALSLSNGASQAHLPSTPFALVEHQALAEPEDVRRAARALASAPRWLEPALHVFVGKLPGSSTAHRKAHCKQRNAACRLLIKHALA